jgi:hypothetical protein
MDRKVLHDGLWSKQQSPTKSDTLPDRDITAKPSTKLNEAVAVGHIAIKPAHPAVVCVFTYHHCVAVSVVHQPPEKLNQGAD